LSGSPASIAKHYRHRIALPFEITSQLPRLRLLSVVVSIIAALRCLLRVYLTPFVKYLPYVLFAIMASSSMFNNQVVTQALIILKKQSD
jgi:hypothetical protein